MIGSSLVFMAKLFHPVRHASNGEERSVQRRKPLRGKAKAPIKRAARAVPSTHDSNPAVRTFDDGSIIDPRWGKLL
jgi:hypothetical protein